MEPRDFGLFLYVPSRSEAGSPPRRNPDAPAKPRVETDHPGLGELLSNYRRPKAAGIVPHWPARHGVTTSMNYRDPDNNRVELQIDNFVTSAKLRGTSELFTSTLRAKR